MHYREAGVVVGGGGGRSGLHVDIQLRPAHAKHVSDHTHKAVLDIGELRRLLRTLAVDDDESVLIRRKRAVVVVPAEHGIIKTLAGVAGAGAEKCVGYSSVVIVYESDGRPGRTRLYVRRYRDCAIRIARDVGTTDVFGQAAAAIH